VTDIPSMLTVAEVAQRLSISAGQVRRLIAHGRLRALDVGLGGRRSWRVPLDALEELVTCREGSAFRGPAAGRHTADMTGRGAPTGAPSATHAAGEAEQ
jgi:excisionase family DNA binding protein